MNKIILEETKKYLDRHNILLSAFKKINESRDYYKSLSHIEDVEHNMERLFTELNTLHGMMFNEDVELLDTIWGYEKKGDEDEN